MVSVKNGIVGKLRKAAYSHEEPIEPKVTFLVLVCLFHLGCLFVLFGFIFLYYFVNLM